MEITGLRDGILAFNWLGPSFYGVDGIVANAEIFPDKRANICNNDDLGYFSIMYYKE